MIKPDLKKLPLDLYFFAFDQKNTFFFAVCITPFFCGKNAVDIIWVFFQKRRGTLGGFLRQEGEKKQHFFFL